MARISILFLAGLLVGCNNNPADNGETGTDGPCEECNDTGGETLVTFVAPPILFEGVEENCQSNLLGEDEGKIEVQTGKEKEILSGDYIITYGDPKLASEVSGGLPVHTLQQNGWMAVSPAITFTVTEESPTPDPPFMNLLPEKGEWTCDFNDGSDVARGATSYRDGSHLTLPGVGEVTVNGTTLSGDVDGVVKEGRFLSNIFIQVSSSGGMAGSYAADCWAGAPAKDPRSH